MAKRKRSRRRRRRGMGSIITVRKAGMRGLFGKGPMVAMPPLMGGGVTAVTSAGIRYFVDPTKGNLQANLVRWSWIWSTLAGLGISSAMYAVGGKRDGVKAFATSATASLVVGGALWLNDWLIRSGATYASGVSVADGVTASVATPSATGAAGIGAIVFQRPGMGRIVPEKATQYLGSGRGMGSPYGETVQLAGGMRGIDTNVFGTSPF